MKPRRDCSVRPPIESSRLSGGPGVVAVGEHEIKNVEMLRAELRVQCGQCVQLRWTDGAIAGDDARDDVAFDELCAPCEDEEQAEMPACLPDVYQPTPSEYADHCVTHYPFRVWCRHCLEGRGREFAHEHHRGDKDRDPCR